jgi:hypothetical protein
METNPPTQFTPDSPEELPGAAGRGISPLPQNLEFEPVPVRPRHDGWTAERQIAFIEALTETACVDEACRRVGMSDTSAYKLRSSYRGREFRRAWDAALDCTIHRLEQSAVSRAINGVARPIFYKGEQVGEWRYFDERLTMFLMRSRRPKRYGKWLDRMLAPDPVEYEDEAIRLDGHLDCIEYDETDDDEG